jgi:hypothetical protein
MATLFAAGRIPARKVSPSDSTFEITATFLVKGTDRADALERFRSASVNLIPRDSFLVEIERVRVLYSPNDGGTD